MFKKIHTSNETFTFQRSGNFGGRKRRAIGNALEDNEEVIFEVHILSLQIVFFFCPISNSYHIWQVPSIMESGNGALTWVIFHPIFTSLIGMPQIYIHSFIWKGCRIHLQVKTLVRRVRDAGRENGNSRR